MDILERRAHGWDVILYRLSCCEIYCVNKSAVAQEGQHVRSNVGRCTGKSADV